MLDQSRQTQRYQGTIRDDEQSFDLRHSFARAPVPTLRLSNDLEQAKTAGLAENVKRVYRIWRQERLKVSKKKRKRRRLGDSSNSIIRRRAEGINDVWSWDFVFDRTHEWSPAKVAGDSR